MTNKTSEAVEKEVKHFFTVMNMTLPPEEQYIISDSTPMPRLLKDILHRIRTTAHAQGYAEGKQAERLESLQVVTDNAEDYIKREKGCNPFPTVEESAVRGFVQYLKDNTTVPSPTTNSKDSV